MLNQNDVDLACMTSVIDTPAHPANNGTTPTARRGRRQDKQGRIKRSLLCDCQFQLVLNYNREDGSPSGKPVEQEVLDDIRTVLRQRFGGYALLGSPKVEYFPSGAWNDLEEPSVRIEVAVPKDRRAELRDYVIGIGRRLKQKEMYYVHGRPCVECIRIENAG